MNNKATLMHIFSAITLLGSSASWAQELSLSDAQKMARENNPSIRQMNSEVEISRAKVTKALAPQLPQVNATARHLLDQKFQVMEVSLGPTPIEFPVRQPLSQVTLGASLLVFDGFGTWNNYRSAKYERSAKELEFERAEFELNQKVRDQYFKTLGSQALVEVAKQSVSMLEAHLDDVKNMIKGGVATKLDLLKVEVQLEDAKTDLLAAEDNAVLSVAQLARVLGVNSITGPLQGKLPVLEPDMLKKLDLTKAERVDRRALLNKEESAMAKSSASLSAWSPKIYLFGQQEWYNFESSDIGGNSRFKDAYTVGVMLNWNLFDGGASTAERTIALEEIKKTREGLRALDQSIPVDIDFWKRKLTHGIAVYQSGLSGIKKSEETIRLAKSAVRAGTRTNTEVLDAEHDLNVAKAKVVHAQIDAVESVSNLELALGKSLDILPGKEK
jgi:outer membrane protein